MYFTLAFRDQNAINVVKIQQKYDKLFKEKLYRKYRHNYEKKKKFGNTGFVLMALVEHNLKLSMSNNCSLEVGIIGVFHTDEQTRYIELCEIF